MSITWSLILACCITAKVCANEASSGGKPTNSAPASFFDFVRQRAMTLARQPGQASESKLPDSLKNLSYDAYQMIRFRPGQALWHSDASRFQVEFFHPGYLFREPVRIHTLEGGQVHDVLFSPNFFDYGTNHFAPPLSSSNLFFVGLRLLYPVNQPQKMDQIAAFLGSSFFRLLGAHQVFGASARGLAIDTAEPSGEEFPRFTEFWIEKPGAAADFIQLYALLESKRVMGAYAFVIRPGEETVAEVTGSLFFRETIKKLGLAPLTSMFYYGENKTQYFPDYRPEVHDSDGLLVEAAPQRWLWRPLCNPPKIHRVSSFAPAVCFGLLQRDRDFSHYQDLESHFQARPSYWVVPEGAWPAGRVELVEIPTSEERNDNIVAYWVPEQKLERGAELSFRYSLRAFLTSADRPSANLCRVQETRLQPGKDGKFRVFVDFAGGSPLLTAGGPVDAGLEATKAKVENLIVQANTVTGGWRVFFDLIPNGQPPMTARLSLRQAGKVRSETWAYEFSSP